MLSYAATTDRVLFTATGFVSEDEATETFEAIRDDSDVAQGLPWLMDLRQYDHTSMTPGEMGPRIERMFKILGPKLGKYWAIVLASHVGHLLKGRLVQQIVQGDDATVMLFTEMAEAEDWLVAMSRRAKLSES